MRFATDAGGDLADVPIPIPASSQSFREMMELRVLWRARSLPEFEAEMPSNLWGKP